MARRSRKNPVPVGLVLGIVAAVLGLMIAVALLSKESRPYRTVDTLDVQSYLENANSLRGNTYRLDAEVLNSLAMSPTTGRLISVQAKEGGVVPVMVPPRFDRVNIQRGQRYVFMLQVDERGILQVTDLTKS